MRKCLPLLLLGALAALPIGAQQTGSIQGTVTGPDGGVLPGVTVEATSSLLPRARVVVTGGGGDYQLPLLPPGDYTVTFTLSGMDTATRQVTVLLNQTISLDVALSPEAVREEIEVVAEASLLDRTSAEIKSALPEKVIESLPVGQQYRDLIKLIPGVQISQDTVRGPSAGGSGQDNVYNFDGVNVTLPLFGTLSAEPSAHDVAQVSIVKGGAQAVDFNRSGGFLIDSVSKSGTNDYHVDASYQIQNANMTSDRKHNKEAQFDQDKSWGELAFSGPIWRQHLLFYGSYYRPEVKGDNRAGLYGPAPDYEENRDEYFGKLTWTPSANVLVNASYRDSDHDISGDLGLSTASFNPRKAGSTSTGADSSLTIGTLEGSWIVNDKSFFSFKYTDFENDTRDQPDNRFSFPIRVDGSVHLDIANLDRQGLFEVPAPIAGETAYNAFIAPLISRYGFLQNGVRTGGGFIGAGSTISLDDFFRKSAQGGYDYTLSTGRVTHELHGGFQWYRDEEDLARFSNGWGSITVQGGRTQFNGQPVFYTARFQQQSLENAGGNALVPVIHSEYESKNFELNDTIKWANWSVNAGVLLSKDTLFGQGLREVSGNVSGFALAPGHKYEMYDIGWGDMVSPRLGATWAYNGRDTVYASIARYYPAASSLPRAASWDRNLAAEREAYFDANGNLIGSQALASSSGKRFADDLDPRGIDEYMVGTGRQINQQWTARAYARYRYGYNFWEDTNNTARVAFNPPNGIPRTPYVSNLAQVQSEIGGSSYVIAELDGAFTKFYEVNLETEHRTAKSFVRGSYVWSHYYGNFDQDNTTTGNDANIFVGSSFIGDGAGRQLWDHRYGDLRGDRRHQVKVYGFYELDWHASVGGLAYYQSGQPWEIWSYKPYVALTSSTSDASRFAEPAGSRTTPAHYQLDLNYTQDFTFGSRYGVQLRLDVFNVFDKQTGYNIQNQINTPSLGTFGQPRSYFEPRRVQLAVRFHI